MRGRWAPLVAAASVIAVVVAVSLVFGRSGGGEPPAIRLAAGSEAGTAADLPLPAAAKRAGSSAFQLVGSLPSGPAEARIHPLPRGAATIDDVRRLAGALGIDATPKRVDDGWAVGALRVQDSAGNPWSMYAGCAPDAAVSSDGASTSCSSGSVSSGSGSASAPGAEPAPAVSPCPDNARCAAPGWAPPPPPPSPGPKANADTARRAATPVLQAVGLADAAVTVLDGGEHAVVQAAPRLAGLPTTGFDTTLEVDAAGRLLGGNGFLGHPTDGPSYPLVSATDAFEALPVPPMPMTPCQEGAQCATPPPNDITGAHLGLAFTGLDEEDAALLPVWMFDVEGWTSPLVQSAVEPRFLSTQQQDPPGKTDPGLVDPAPAARSSFAFDTAYPTDEPKQVIVQYGDSGSCPHTDVEPQVKETASSVTVVLEADTQPPDRACTADYRQMLVTIPLTSALGDRTVIDGSRDEPVAVDRHCARPMVKPAPPKDCVDS